MVCSSILRYGVSSKLPNRFENLLPQVRGDGGGGKVVRISAKPLSRAIEVLVLLDIVDGVRSSDLACSRPLWMLPGGHIGPACSLEWHVEYVAVGEGGFVGEDFPDWGVSAASLELQLNIRGFLRSTFAARNVPWSPSSGVSLRPGPRSIDAARRQRGYCKSGFSPEMPAELWQKRMRTLRDERCHESPRGI